MKLKRKLIAALAASVMLTACGAEEKGETSETQTAPVQTTATAIQTTKAAVKTIKPLSPMKSHAYYQDESFSVTVSLDDLRSSLYYPDAVAEMGINPDMFAVDMTVKVKISRRRNRASTVQSLRSLQAKIRSICSEQRTKKPMISSRARQLRSV